MRTADETLTLLEAGLKKRRLYLRRRLNAIKPEGRKRQPELSRMMRGGMLSELSTVSCLIKWIRAGTIHPDELWNVEDDPDD